MTKSEWLDAVADEIPALFSEGITQKNTALLADCLIIKALSGNNFQNELIPLNPVNVTESEIIPLNVTDSVLKIIEDELKDCDKYIKKWHETQIAVFNELAKDELKHSEQLIKMVREQKLNMTENDKISDLISWHDSLLAKF